MRELQSDQRRQCKVKATGSVIARDPQDETEQDLAHEAHLLEDLKATAIPITKSPDSETMDALRMALQLSAIIQTRWR